MKTFRKVLVLFTLAFSLIATSCDGLLGGKDEPETTEKTFTPADVNDKNFPKDENGQPIQFPEGTTIEFKKVEEEDKTTTDYTATEPDGTKIVFHEEEVGKENKDGKITTTVTSKKETTFSDTDSSGKKSEVIEITTSDEETATKGEVKEVKTTTEFKDGSKEVSTKNTEGLTGYSKTSKETFNKDGNKTASEEIEHFEIDPSENKTTAEGIRVSSTETSEKFTYDAQGNKATKTVTETTNPGLDGFFNKRVQTEYKFVNGEPVEAKRTEHLKLGCDEEKIFEVQTDGSKKITITVKDINNGASLGTGSGTTDKNGKTTFTIKYTNGIELTTVEENDTVTKEILITTSNGKPYYEKSVTEKGELKSKECEYLYDKWAGIVFKTVSTFTNGKETGKSGRYIKNENLSPAKYDEANAMVPSENIYEEVDTIKIKADGQNAEPYTTFTTIVWDGPSSKDINTDYPFDSSVDMTNLHLLDAE